MVDLAFRRLACRKFARVVFAAVLACAGMLLLGDSASAEYRHVNGTHSAGAVGRECGSRGGDFYKDKDGGYGCILNDGGTLTSVECTSKGSCACQGPKCAAVVKRGLKGLRPPASAGTASAAHGNTPSKRKRPIHNVGLHKVNSTGGNNTRNSSKKSSKH